MAEYASLGGMAQVMQNEVDNLLAADPEQRQAQLDILHDAFIPWLATVNPDSDQPMRRLARWDNLRAASQPLIQAMVEKRLLVKDTRDGQTVVEVALESLLRQWRELAAWLRDEAQDLKDADSLERAAADWHASGYDESWLLEGTRLAEAEALAAKPGFRDRLNPTRDYLQASRARENQRIEAEKQRQEAELQAAREKQETVEKHATALRKRSRILRIVLAVTLLVAAAAVYGFVTATNARHQADSRTLEAVAQRLTSQGEAMLADVRGGGEVRALQQILAASRIAPTADPGVQLTALLARPYPAKIIETPAPVTSVAFSPDGTRIVSGSIDNTLRLWDAGTGQPVGQPLTGHTGAVYDVAFSPDGRRVASGSTDDTLRLWDAGTGQQIGPPLTGHTDVVSRVAFSPDGKRIASGSYDNMVRVWPGPELWPELLCAKLTTNMSYQQWRGWVSPDIDYARTSRSRRTRFSLNGSRWPCRAGSAYATEENRVRHRLTSVTDLGNPPIRQSRKRPLSVQVNRVRACERAHLERAKLCCRRGPRRTFRPPAGASWPSRSVRRGPGRPARRSVPRSSRYGKWLFRLHASAMATSTKVMLAIVLERLSPWQSDTPKIAESSPRPGACFADPFDAYLLTRV